MTSGFYINIIKSFLEREWEFLLYKRRKLLYFSILAPVFVCLLLMGVFHNPVIRELPIAVTDNDNSEISRELASRINASPNVKIVKSVHSAEEAKRLIASGEIYGAVIIPENFSKRVLGYKGAEAVFVYNNEMFLLGSVAYKGVFGAISDFSKEYNIKFMMKSGIPAYSAAFQAAPVVLGEHNLFNRYLNYRYFFLLGMFPAVLQLFIICVVIYAFSYEEKTKSFLDVAHMVSEAPLSCLIGKSLPYYAIFTAVAGIMLFLTFVYMGTPFRAGFFTVIISTLLFIAASVTAGITIAVLFRHVAFSAAAVYAAPTFAYAGVTYPQIAMPDLAYAWSNMLPLTHYHKIMVNEAIRGAGPGTSSYFDVLYLFIFSFLMFTAAIIITRFYGKKYDNGNPL